MNKIDKTLTLHQRYKQKCNIKNRTMFCRDNLEVMRGINSECIDLIYLDPPFNKNKKFTAPIGASAEGASFKDIFHKEDVKDEWLGIISEQNPALSRYIDGIADTGYRYNKYYLTYMAIRILEMHRILKPTGSLYLHCDPTMSHYLKILLDSIFEEKHFKNEVIWHYFMGGKAKKFFARKHDVIFFYSKTNKYQYNSMLHNRRLDFKPSLGNPYNAKQGEKGYIGKDEYGYFSTVLMDDVWDIRGVFNMSNQYVGYPTQKPLALLERIIKASSKEGDVVLDPFCGCATTCVAAEKLGREWIGIDISKKAYQLVQERLKKEIWNNPDALYQYKKIPNIISRTDIPNKTKQDPEEFELSADDMNMRDKKRLLYGQQIGICKGCELHFQIQNLTIDHIVPRESGGGDEIENLMLLCGHCNSVKGHRGDLAYLKAELKKKGIIK